MLGCLKNFIGKLKGNFLNMNDMFGTSFLQLMINFIEKTYANCNESGRFFCFF